ncbi:MAG: DUF1553 domain-containing protein [Verrucomicrobiales bacterium]
MRVVGFIRIALPAVLVANLAAAEEVDFVRDVRPIFEAHCYDCHGPDHQKSGLRLDAKPAALEGGEYHQPNIVPGSAGDSMLIQFVRGDVEDMRMPQKGEPLSEKQIAILEAWIDGGAVWPEGVDKVQLDDPADHWSFKPMRRPEPPSVKQAGWPRGEIDRFILRRLEEEGLPPSSEADSLAWLRRVHFDLVGLPPTPEKVEAFLGDDSGNARAAVVEELLASPRYGERWAQHWLDVVRYADTHGFEVNTPRPGAWPYRDYVIDAFNRDLPYDRFVLEQLAGDTVDRDAATGFLVTAAALLPGQIGKDEASMRLARQDELGEVVTNVGEAFLGLSVACAKCHDHKFDPVTAEDYYSLQAFFAGVDYGERPVEDPAAEKEAEALRSELAPAERELAAFVPVAGSGAERPAVRAAVNIDRFPPVETDAVRFTILETNKLEPCLDELEIFTTEGTNIALGSQGAKTTFSGSKVASDRHEESFVNDGQYGNSRSWMSNETGKGWVQFEFPDKRSVERVNWGRDREGKFQDRLALDYRIEVRDDDGKWTTVADHTDRAEHDPEDKTTDILADVDSLPETGEAKKLLERRGKILEQLERYPDGGRMIFAGKFREPDPTRWLRRGDPEQPQEEVPPAVPAFLRSEADALGLDSATPDRDRRLALAEWIARPDHPLTARVMVNRVWLWHFGEGLVETANDFGNSGAEPSHPELLDWLATEFVRSGWSVKHLHRLIVLSTTYGQSSRVRPEGETADAGVRLLWRFPSRRIEAEAIRDSMLAVSGRLNLETGGPGFDLFKSRGGLSGFSPIESFGKEGRRRMIYAHRIRMEREAVFGAFDCPDAGQSSPRRSRSTTPLQALNLFNSRFTQDEAQALAARLESEAGSDLPDQVRRAWELVFARDPESDELADAVAVAGEHGLATLCRALYNTSEFLFMP